MNFQRSGGVLLHPTSLPGPHGIGDLGPEAHHFVDWLAEAACRLWQVLPLGHTGYGDSPYQCFSAFAGNPNLISPDLLESADLLTKEDLQEPGTEAAHARAEAMVDYASSIPRKAALLEKAFQRFTDLNPVGLREEFASFREQNAEWLEDYALFMALKQQHGGGSWVEWPEPIRKREQPALTAARESLAEQTLRFTFQQFLFFQQWHALQSHVHDKDITIIGDIPIFVAEDSADVWAHPELFHLDEERRSTVVAGVPPDYFSPTGQRWGNPLYRWEEHRKTGYAWWIQRFHAILHMVDVVRLDHFRGFAGYWEIPAANHTAEIGRWMPGPGADFLEAVKGSLEASSVAGDLPIIAEDLGLITPDVVELRDNFHLPGMRILQFGFSDPTNPFLPHHYPQHCVAYTGTHDNDTTRGWLNSASKAEKRLALKYLGSTPRNFVWEMIRAIWGSVAVYSVTPMQDLLDLGTEARMNFPSRLGGNWQWRLGAGELTDMLASKLKELNYLYSR